MATRIRLQRHGRKNYAFYYIVIANSSAPRDGRFVEKIGTFNPNTLHPYSFSFTQTGSARVRFTRSCDTKTYQYNGEFGSQEVRIPGCGSKHVDYDLNIIGVASVSGNGEIESVEEDVIAFIESLLAVDALEEYNKNT